jgi:hypothetical protein
MELADMGRQQPDDEKRTGMTCPDKAFYHMYSRSQSSELETSKQLSLETREDS